MEIRVGPTKEERQRAEDTLSYIRQTMESATGFTALSGWGVVAVGLVGFTASWLDWAVHATVAPLRVWIPAAIIGALASAVGNAVKARRLNVSLWSGSLQKMVWGLAPALVAGTFLTLTLADVVRPLIPGMWLAVYGAGIAAGGVFSVRAIRVMGVCLLALGGLALFEPSLGPLLLAAGFGGVHLVFGLYIVMRHGG